MESGPDSRPVPSGSSDFYELGTRFRSWAVRGVGFGRKLLRGKYWRGWTLACAILAYTVVFTAYVLGKYDDYRAGFFDFGNAVQLVWLTSQGHLTAYVYDRPVMLIPALFSLVAPVPVVLAVMEALMLAVGAVPLYLIAVHVLRNRNYALGFALFYLVYPPLTGINQYEFHDLSMCVPFVLFLIYFYLIRARWPFIVSAILALSTTEYAVIMIAFLVVPILWDYFESGRPRRTLQFAILSIVLAALWVGYLQSTVLVPTYTLSTVSNQAYTFTGSAAFVNPSLILKNPWGSFNYYLSSKLLYLFLVLAPLLFLPFGSPRWIIPALPWIGITLFYSPLLAQGGVGAGYTVWSQWSSFILPFVVVSAVFGFRIFLPREGAVPRRWQRPRPVFQLIAVAVVLSVVTVGAFSPFLGQTTLSIGDELVPTDVAPGSIVHGVWPTPVANAGALARFVALVPASDSVLTQNPIGAKLAERTAPVWIMDQPGYKLNYPQAVLVDTEMVGFCSSCLSQVLSGANYTVADSDPAAGITLYLAINS